MRINRKINRLILFLPLSLLFNAIYADDIKECKSSKEMNVRFNILGGPSYTPDFGWIIGGSCLFTFSTNPKDSLLKRSVVPTSVAVMLNGGVATTIRPQLFFNEDKFRIFGQFVYKNSMENYYGIGYDTNKNYVRGKETSQYRSNNFIFNPCFLFRLKESPFFVGPQLDISYDSMTDIASGIKDDISYISSGGTDNGYHNFSSGLGFILSYDTRDIPANAYKGVFFDVKGLFYQKWLGSDNNYYRFDLDYRQYQSVGNRCVFAWTVQTKNVFGNHIPLNKYVMTGSPFDLRGYYMGQFRDKSSHIALLEYRQMFNTDNSNKFKRLLSRLGYTVWGGVGLMGKTPFDIDGVLPNAGFGLRIEVQPRMNIRLDIGRDFVSKQNLFYINMTEAF